MGDGKVDEKEVRITYETLFEILKREKDRAELQKLDIDFFNDVVSYIKEKRKVISSEDSLFSFEDKKKTEKQIDNIKKILKELYDRREKKIIGIALDKSRTKSNIIDTSAMIQEEKQFFNLLVELLDKFRLGILDNLLNEKIPSIEQEEINKKIIESSINTEVKNLNNELKRSTKLIRFIHAVPKFVGKDLEDYGPFEEEDVANLPAEIADVLISKGRVEEIKEN